MTPRTEARPGEINTILVPTDFSQESYKALHYGAALAAKFGAALHVLHVSEIDFAPPGPALPNREPLFTDPALAQAIKEQIETASGQSVTATFHGRTGRAYDQICRFARELGADLVVISTHGRTGIKRIFMGSNAQRVVQHSSIPVLIVRQSEREFVVPGKPLAIEKILVPTDFSESSREGLEYAVNFGRQFGARLVIFHSYQVAEILTPEPYLTYDAPLTQEEVRAAAEKEMREFLKGIDFSGLTLETQITNGSPAPEICRYAEEQKIDLIINPTHGRTGLMHVLLGSVAEHIVRYAHTPVLVVPGSIKRKGASPSA